MSQHSLTVNGHSMGFYNRCVMLFLTWEFWPLSLLSMVFKNKYNWEFVYKNVISSTKTDGGSKIKIIKSLTVT